MVKNIADAVAAYANVARVPMAVPGMTDKVEAGIEGFSDLVKQAVHSAVDISLEGERMSQLALAGKADIRDVVQAVTNAEMTLETIVAVRDKVISAYNEILRMSI